MVIKFYNFLNEKYLISDKEHNNMIIMNEKRFKDIVRQYVRDEVDGCYWEDESYVKKKYLVLQRILKESGIGDTKLRNGYAYAYLDSGGEELEEHEISGPTDTDPNHYWLEVPVFNKIVDMFPYPYDDDTIFYKLKYDKEFPHFSLKDIWI